MNMTLKFWQASFSLEKLQGAGTLISIFLFLKAPSIKPKVFWATILVPFFLAKEAHFLSGLSRLEVPHSKAHGTHVEINLTPEIARRAKEAKA